MKIAFILFKYFPFGGLQRDFFCIAVESSSRGHEIEVFSLPWQGDKPENFNIHIVPVKALSNHKRYELFQQWVQDDLNRRTVDVVVGFNEMPGLELYYAADACYAEKAQQLGSSGRVRILSGRDDIPRFLLGADVLIHQAYNENTVTVLLEAMASGLPVLVTDVCGYACYIEQAQARVQIHSPFEQQHLNAALLDMLTNKPAQQQWQQNALNFTASADIYSLPEHAADLIEHKALQKKHQP